MKTNEEIIKEFREKFTQIVEYTKWSDEEEAQRLPKPELVWKDIVKNDPKMVESFLTSTITDIQMQTARAFGNCAKCYGKGYSTYRHGLKTPADFEGDKDVCDPMKTHMNFCDCDRGRQLKEQITDIQREMKKDLLTKMKPALDDFTSMGKKLIQSKQFENTGNEVIENVGYIKGLFITDPLSVIRKVMKEGEEENKRLKDKYLNSLQSPAKEEEQG